jgi:hypothetical protein
MIYTPTTVLVPRQQGLNDYPTLIRQQKNDLAKTPTRSL